MNIVYICKYAGLPEFGGRTRQYFLSKNLIKNNKEDRVLLIASRSSMSKIPAFKGLALEKEEGNFEAAILNGPTINMGFNIKRITSWVIFEMNLWRYLKRIRVFKPDVIIVSSLSILTFISGVLFKRWFKVPLVIEVLDIYPLTLIEIGGYSKWNPVILFLKWLEKVGYKNADLLISPLSNVDKHFAEVLNRPYKYKWIPMGVDLDYYHCNRNEGQGVSKSFIRKQDEFIIGYAGTFGTANALDIIFEAAKSIELSHPKIRFFFIGRGPLEEFYKTKYKTSKNVTFHEAVSKRELQSYLKEMDVLINTWLDRPIYRFGNSPNKWIDYMLAAKPMLVSYSGYDPILRSADCGVLVPSEDKEALINAILKLSETPKDELERIGNNGRKYLYENLQYKKLSEDLRQSIIDILPKN